MVKHHCSPAFGRIFVLTFAKHRGHANPILKGVATSILLGNYCTLPKTKPASLPAPENGADNNPKGSIYMGKL